MMAAIAFRQAAYEDFGSVKALFREGIRGMLAAGIEQWDEQYPGEDILESDIKSGCMYVCCLSGAVVSAMAFNEYQDPEYEDVAWQYRQGKTGVIHRVCVHPDAQGKGVAKQMISFMEDRARGMGYACIRLDTFSGNAPALALYRSLGYTYVGDVFFAKGKFHCFEKALAQEAGTGG
jgi:ribosomal protein S18 acetylase RimI-like enzyme